MATTAQDTRTETASSPIGTMDAGSVLWLYLDSIDVADTTRRAYGRALKRYAAWAQAAEVNPLRATAADVREYKRSLSEGHSAATVNAYLSAVRGFYSWFETLGGCNPAANVKGVKRHAAIGHDALSAEQARAVCRSQGETLEQLRDAAIITLMAHRGLRCIEVSRADVGDMRTIGGVRVLFVQGKGRTSKDDYVLLGGAAERAIDAYMAARGRTAADAPLFAGVGNRHKGGRLTTRTIGRIVRAAYEREGISDAHITPHSLRHTAVTLALEGGATVQQAQAMARHASIETTMIYAHNLNRLEGDAEAGVDRLIDGE
jgi:integrase/recombinase XerD